ncbi:MAG TPA: hypothetical protein VMF66_09225 [Candidatus Acidoferrum sp.]|nr:hypothetical protein [Candidatus Acidoferrum sp.]
MTQGEDVARIQQLIPYDGKWEFQYMLRNYPNEIGVQRVPMLGLALIDFPKGDDEYEQMIVHFGKGWLTLKWREV